MRRNEYLLSTRAMLGHVIQLWWAMRIDLGNFVNWSRYDWRGWSRRVRYDGISAFPVRFKIARQMSVNGRFNFGMSRGIRALEQPFRSEENILRVIEYLANHWRWDKFEALKVIPSFLFVPERRHSLRHLGELDQKLAILDWNMVPTTIYPYHKPRLSPIAYVDLDGRHWNEDPYDELELFGERLVRPTARLTRGDFWAVSTPNDFWQIAHDTYKYAGICLNVGDLESMYPANWQDALDIWLGHIQVVEVDGRTLDEAFTLNVLGYLKKNGWHGKYVVTKVPGRHWLPGSFFAAAEEVLVKLLYILEG